MARQVQDVRAVEARIGHVFADRNLIAVALTHVSAAAGRKHETYQRL